MQTNTYTSKVLILEKEKELKENIYVRRRREKEGEGFRKSWEPATFPSHPTTSYQCDLG